MTEDYNQMLNITTKNKNACAKYGCNMQNNVY